jgi:hypothetical protein
VQQAAIDASAKAKATGASVPVGAATDAENTLTANPDGTFSQTTSASPVRVQQNGAWVPVDATLHRNSDGTWSPAATNAALTLSGGGPAGSTLASMDDNGQTLAFTWPTALPTPTVTGDQVLYPAILPAVDLELIANDQGGFTDLVIVHTPAAAQNPALATLTMGTSSTSGITLHTDQAGNITATATDGTLVYTAPAPRMYDSANPTATRSPSASTTPSDSTGASGTMTTAASASASPSSTAGSASPAAQGAQAKTAQRLALAAQSTGTPTASTSPSSTPQATPSASSTTGADPTGAVQSAPVAVAVSTGRLTLTPNQQLLHSTSATFPLVIDPSYTPIWIGHTTSSGDYDYIQAGCPSAKNFDASNSYDANGIGVGYQGFATCDGAERSEYQFNIGSWIENKTIAGDATLNVDETYIAWNACDSSNNYAQSNVTAWAVPHIDSSTDWSNYNGLGATWLDTESIGGANRTGCAGNTATSFKVSRAITDTPDGIVTLELRGNESDEYQFKRFATHATLVFNYNSTPNIPTGTTTTPATVSPAGTCNTDRAGSGWIPVGGAGGYVNVSAVFSDNDGQWGQDVMGKFQIWNSSTGASLLDTGTTGSWMTSGSTASARISTSSLTDGDIYGWQSETYDGFTSSAASPICYFKYDSTPPVNLAVNGHSLNTGQCVQGDDLLQGATGQTLHLTATDAESGLKNFTYAWGDSSPLAAGGGAVVASNGNLSFTPMSWGVFTLWVDATDNAGNQAAYGCYTFNVDANDTLGSTPGDVDGYSGTTTNPIPQHPDVLSTDASGNLLVWPTYQAGGTAKIASTNTNGPNPDGTWTGALYSHRGPVIGGSGFMVDELWALGSDRTAMYLYHNQLNVVGTTAANGPYYTTSNTDRIDIYPCTAACNGHPTDWSQVNQLLSVGDMNGDGLPDLITEEAGGKLWYFPSNGSHKLGAPTLLATWKGADARTFIAPGNTTGDQGIASIWGRDNATGTIYTWAVTVTNGVPSLGTQTTIGSNFDAADYPQILSVGDLGTDGRPDLIATTATGALVEAANTGTATTPAFDGTTDTTHPGPAQIQPGGWALAQSALDSNPTPNPPSGQITMALGSLCLDDPQAAQSAGKPVQTYTCNGSPAQQWTLTPDRAIHPQRNTAICVSGGVSGTALTLQTCNGSTAQLWTPNSDGTHSLVNAATTACLDDPQSSTTPGTQLQTWHCNGSTAQSYTPSTSTPTARWLLNDTGPGAWNSASNQHTTGTNVTYQQTGPVLPAGSGTGKSAAFNGTSSIITTDSTIVATDRSYTVSAWVNPSTLTGQQWAVTQAGTNKMAFYLGRGTGGWQFMTTNDDTATSTFTGVNSTQTPTTGTWTQLTGVYDATAKTISLYVNGTLAGTTPYTGAHPTTGNLSIGAATSGYEYFNGDIADVQTFNQALNPRQILNLADTDQITG